MHSGEPEICWSLASHRHSTLWLMCWSRRARRTKEMSNTTLLLSEEEGLTEFHLVSKLEKEKAEEVLEWVEQAVDKVLGEGNEKVGEYLGWSDVEVVN